MCIFRECDVNVAGWMLFFFLCISYLICAFISLLSELCSSEDLMFWSFNSAETKRSTKRHTSSPKDRMKDWERGGEGEGIKSYSAQHLVFSTEITNKNIQTNERTNGIRRQHGKHDEWNIRAAFALYRFIRLSISFYEKVSGLGMECSQAINIYNAFMLCAFKHINI